MPAAAATVIGSEAIHNVDLLNELGNAYLPSERIRRAVRASRRGQRAVDQRHATGIRQIIDLATA